MTWGKCFSKESVTDFAESVILQNQSINLENQSRIWEIYWKVRVRKSKSGSTAYLRRISFYEKEAKQIFEKLFKLLPKQA